MTALELEIQKLRRENAALRKALDAIRKKHQADIAEITFLRRLLECIVESGEDKA